MPRRFAPEFRQRALRLIDEAVPGHETEYAAIRHVGAKLGVGAETPAPQRAHGDRDLDELAGLPTDAEACRSPGEVSLGRGAAHCAGRPLQRHGHPKIVSNHFASSQLRARMPLIVAGSGIQGTRPGLQADSLAGSDRARGASFRIPGHATYGSWTICGRVSRRDSAKPIAGSWRSGADPSETASTDERPKRGGRHRVLDDGGAGGRWTGYGS